MVTRESSLQKEKEEAISTVRTFYCTVVGFMGRKDGQSCVAEEHKMNHYQGRF